MKAGPVIRGEDGLQSYFVHVSRFHAERPLLAQNRLINMLFLTLIVENGAHLLREIHVHCLHSLLACFLCVYMRITVTLLSYDRHCQVHLLQLEHNVNRDVFGGMRHAYRVFCSA